MRTDGKFYDLFHHIWGQGRNEERSWSHDRAGVGLPGQHTVKGERKNVN